MNGKIVYNPDGSYRIVVGANSDGPVVRYNNVATCVVDNRRFIGFSNYFDGTGAPQMNLGGKVFEVTDVTSTSKQ